MIAAGARPDAVASVLLTEQAGELDAVAGCWLTAGEQERAASFGDAGDRRDYQAAHLLVRQVAARLLDEAPGGLSVVQRCARCGGPHGRPVIRGHPSLHVSLAHTRGAVIAAASVAPVGVDIESLRRPRFPLSLVKPALTTAEFLAISGAADQHAAFLLQWARKEALVKLGAGAVGRMGEIDLGHLSISGKHDPAPVPGRPGPGWPRLLLLDRVDAASGIAFAVISHRPVLLCPASGSLAAAARAASASMAHHR